MGQTSRISKNNTVILKENGITTVILHNTPVVTIDENKRLVTFNNGGWVTATTQVRMTQVCRQYNLAYSIGRAKGDMSCRNYVTGQEWQFDGKTLTVPLQYSNV